MPTSIVEKPHDYENGPTIDGTSFGAINTTNANRHLHGGSGSPSSVIFSGTSGTSTKGIRFYNYFNSEAGGTPIPDGSTILGIEIVAPGSEYMWSSGTSSGDGFFRIYLHNGTSYSDPVEFAHNGDTFNGWSFTDSDRKAIVSANSKKYKNSTSGEDVLFGAADDLHGLSWDVNDQADWGIAYTAGHEDGSTVVIGIQRGIGMRVTYEAGGATSKTVIGIEAPSQVLDLTSISSIIGVS
jgi:hypothetical protein